MRRRDLLKAAGANNVSENAQVREGALAFIRPYVHQILEACRVLAGAERHPVILAEGVALLLDRLLLLLASGQLGVWKRVDDGVEKQHRSHRGSGPRGLIAPVMDPSQGVGRGPPTRRSDPQIRQSAPYTGKIVAPDHLGKGSRSRFAARNAGGIDRF